VLHGKGLLVFSCLCFGDLCLYVFLLQLKLPSKQCICALHSVTQSCTDQTCSTAPCVKWCTRALCFLFCFSTAASQHPKPATCTHTDPHQHVPQIKPVMSAPSSPSAGPPETLGSHPPTREEQPHQPQPNHGNDSQRHSQPQANITDVQKPALGWEPDEEDQEVEAAFLDEQPSQEATHPSPASHPDDLLEEEGTVEHAADPTTSLDTRTHTHELGLHQDVFSLPPSDTALLHRKSLGDCNLTFNRKHKVFICLHAKCQKILGAGEIEDHLAPSTHPAYTTLLPKAARTNALAEVQKVCAEFGLDPKETSPTSVRRVYDELMQEAGTDEACLPVEGLPLRGGVRCGLCTHHHFVYASSRTLRQVHSKEAHGLALYKVEGAIINCNYQALNDHHSCNIDGTKARLHVQPPYQAVMQPIGGDNAASGDNSNACKAFAAKMVSHMLSPLSLTTPTAASSTTTSDVAILAEPTSKRHTDLILSKIGWLSSLSETQTNIQLLSDVTRGPRECAWSAAGFSNVEIVTEAVVHFYMQEGINKRVEREANLDLRGLIGGVQQSGFETKGKKHFASVEGSTATRYAGVLTKTILSVLRQACYQQYIRPSLAFDQKGQQKLDVFFGSLASLDGDVIESAHAFVDSILTWGVQRDASFKPGAVEVSGTKGKYGQRYTTDIQSCNIKDATVEPLLRSFHQLGSRLFFRSFSLAAPPLACAIERSVLGMSFARASGFADLDNVGAVVSALKYAAKGVLFFHILPPWPQEIPLQQALSMRVYLDADGFVDQSLLTISPYKKYVGFGRFVSTISQDTTPIPRLILDSAFPDGRRLYVGGKNRLDFDEVVIGINTTKAMILEDLEVLLEGVPTEIKAQLHSARHLAGITPAETPYAVKDIIDSPIVEFSFCRHMENTQLRCAAARLGESIAHHGGWLSRDGQLVGLDEIGLWVERFDALMKKLLFFNHLTSGMPMRASEHTSIQTRRTATARNQLMILPCGAVVIVPEHCKPNAVASVRRLRPRALNLFAADVTIDVLSCLRPLYNYVLLQFRGSEVELDALYVSNGMRLSDNQVRSCIEEGFTLYIGAPGVNVSGWRQGVNLWARSFLPGLLEKEQKLCDLPQLAKELVKQIISGAELESYDNVSDLQSGHSSYVSERSYGRSESLALTPSELASYVRVSRLYQLLFECDEGDFILRQQRMENAAKSVAVRAVAARNKSVVPSGPAAPVLSLDSSSHSHSANLSFSVDADGKIHVPADLARALLSAGATTATQALSTTVSPLLAPASSFSARTATSTAGLSLVEETSVLAVMGAMLKTRQPRFRNKEQVDAFSALYHLDRSLLLVLGTGLGKSFLFLMLAKLLAATKFVVVILPLRALREDLLRRAEEYGVPGFWWGDFVRLWQRDHELITGGLIVVQQENTTSDNRFQTFMAWAMAVGRLHSCIFDESHLLSSYGTSIRPNDLMTPHVFPPRCPIVCVSATVSPTLATRLSTLLLLENNRFQRVFRGTSVSPHMRYEVVCNSIGADEKGRILVHHIERACKEYLSAQGSTRKQGRGIVYFKDKATLFQLAETVSWQCGDYAQVNTFTGISGVEGEEKITAEEERRFALETFRTTDGDGRFQWLFSSPAGGVGVDFSDVRAVLIQDWPYGIEEMVQMLGRCRPPQDPAATCLGLVLTSPLALGQLKWRIEKETEEELQPHDSVEDHKMRLDSLSAVYDLLHDVEVGGAPTHCLRLQLQAASAGVGLTCMASGSTLCSFCEKLVKKASYDLSLHAPTSNSAHTHTQTHRHTLAQQHTQTTTMTGAQAAVVQTHGVPRPVASTASAAARVFSPQMTSRSALTPAPPTTGTSTSTATTKSPSSFTATSSAGSASTSVLPPGVPPYRPACKRQINTVATPPSTSSATPAQHAVASTSTTTSTLVAPCRPASQQQFVQQQQQQQQQQQLQQRQQHQQQQQLQQRQQHQQQQRVLPPSQRLKTPSPLPLSSSAVAAAVTSSSSTTRSPSLRRLPPPGLPTPDAKRAKLNPLRPNAHVYTVERTNFCLQLLQSACCEAGGPGGGLLDCCVPCLISTSWKWGKFGNPSSARHCPREGAQREYFAACPQYKKGGIMYKKCIKCGGASHLSSSCPVQRPGGLVQMMKTDKRSCDACHLRDHRYLFRTSFHAGDLGFGFHAARGPQMDKAGVVIRQSRAGCALSHTDLFMNVAMTLWSCRPGLFHKLVSRSQGYYEAWHSLFGTDTSKQYGVEPLPLDAIFGWLHSSYFQDRGQGVILNVHAVFILFVFYTSCGRCSTPPDKAMGDKIREALQLDI